MNCKMLERVLDKSFFLIVTVDELQFDFLSERGTIDAVFILIRVQEEYHAKGNSCICVL